MMWRSRLRVQLDDVLVVTLDKHGRPRKTARDHNANERTSGAFAAPLGKRRHLVVEDG